VDLHDLTSTVHDTIAQSRSAVEKALPESSHADSILTDCAMQDQLQWKTNWLSVSSWQAKGQLRCTNHPRFALLCFAFVRPSAATHFIVSKQRTNVNDTNDRKTLIHDPSSVPGLRPLPLKASAVRCDNPRLCSLSG
jgi:hypothetical protein